MYYLIKVYLVKCKRLRSKYILLSSVCIKLDRVLVATDTDECASNPCENEGTCEDKVNSFKCTCVYDLYQGSVCDEGKLMIVLYCHCVQGYVS